MSGAAKAACFAARHRGQYHGAGVFTGRGLRLWQVAQRYRLPLNAVFGRCCFPVRGMLFMLDASPYFHLQRHPVLQGVVDAINIRR